MTFEQRFPRAIIIIFPDRTARGGDGRGGGERKLADD